MMACLNCYCIRTNGKHLLQYIIPATTKCNVFNIIVNILIKDHDKIHNRQLRQLYVIVIRCHLVGTQYDSMRWSGIGLVLKLCLVDYTLTVETIFTLRATDSFLQVNLIRIVFKNTVCLQRYFNTKRLVVRCPLTRQSVNQSMIFISLGFCSGNNKRSFYTNNTKN